MKNSQQTTDPPLPPDVEDSPHAGFGSTSRSRSWLWPAAALIVVLVIAVAIGRLGQTPGESLPVDLPVPPPPRAFVPDRSLTPVANPGGAATSSVPGYRIGIRSDGDRYDDGIPAVLNGDQVVRVRDAATLPSGSTVLVAGWAQRSLCGGLVDLVPPGAVRRSVPVGRHDHAVARLVRLPLTTIRARTFSRRLSRTQAALLPRKASACPTSPSEMRCGQATTSRTPCR